jgi:hypothetical protein
MNKGGMSDKELKLLTAARREAAAARGNAAPPPAAKAGPPRSPAVRESASTPLDGKTVVGWDHAAANATPLDQPTVAGWDHPAARGAAEARDEDGKWSRIAALMESERAAAALKRRIARRRAVTFLGVLLVLAALVAARVLLSR